MSGQWIYLTLVTALLGGAAAAVESALRAAGRPGRWPWLAGAVAGSILGVVVLSGAVAPALTPAPTAGSVAPPGVEILEPWLPSDGPLTVAWILASTVLLGLAVLTEVAGERRRRRGSRARLAGRSVRLSADRGPAACGLLRPEIVVPAWVLELGPRRRRLVVAHELQHLAAGDLAVAAAVDLLTFLFPWNAALWWQRARLARAIELDCDGRVVRRLADPRPYAEVLVEAGRRRCRGAWLAAPGLGRRPALLVRRVELLLVKPGVAAWRRGLGAAVAAALVAAACAVPLPRPSLAGVVRAAPAVVFRAVETPARPLPSPEGTWTFRLRPTAPGSATVRARPSASDARPPSTATLQDGDAATAAPGEPAGETTATARGSVLRERR